MSGTVIFDFDYTLFDTISFKQEMSRVGDGGLPALLDRAADFLLQDANAILEKLNSEGYVLVLLTLGDPAWQKLKLEKSGIKQHFHQTHFAPESKKAIAEVIEGAVNPVIMVNDNGEEIDDFQVLYPTYKMIAMRGPKRAPSDPNVPVCDSLEEVYSLITGR